jgi:hypothetical protein
MRVIREQELSRFVREFYALEDFSCRSCEEWGNDSYHKIVVTGELDDYISKVVDEVKKGLQPYYSTEPLLQDLCSKKAIQPGHYLIEVCW